MKILFKQSNKIEEIEKANSIADAIRYSGHEAGFNSIAILDALYEYKPDIYVTCSETTDEERFACSKYSVEIASLPSKPFANVFRYKTVNKLPELFVEQVCINDYSDHIDLMDYIDKRNIKTFRLFQRKMIGFDCYCGYIPHSYHSLILSSAQEVICNNLQSYYNHLLSNQNCTLIKKLNQYQMSQKDILEYNTCFHGAELLIGNDALTGLEKYLCK